MVFSFFACLYITTVCWGWGLILFMLLKKLSGEAERLHKGFIITCFSGLALIGVYTGFLSLFISLGGALNQLLVLLPLAFVFFIRRDLRKIVEAYYHNSLTSAHPVIRFSLACGLVLVFIMSAGEIIHPDTLHYHAQCIQWIEQYPAIPGLANLGYHFGLQSSWFTVSAMFGLKFTGSNAPTFLNSAVICWYIIFLHQQIHQCLQEKEAKPANNVSALFWFLLYIFSFWIFTQIRVTLSSSSPDFIATIYIWLVFQLSVFIRKKAVPGSYLMLTLFLGIFALTIKLSALPVTLFAAFMFVTYSVKKTRNVLAFLLIGFVIAGPFVARNVITSGYPLFPSPVLNVFAVDWKVPESFMRKQTAFIKAYARAGDYTIAIGNERINEMKLSQWLVLWWEKRSLSNKIIISGLFIALLAGFFVIKEITRKENRPLLYCLIFSLIGIAFWFSEAPDPRFGFGYIIPAESILLYLFARQKMPIQLYKRSYLPASILLFSVVLIGYSVFRLRTFFHASNLLTPAGISRVQYRLQSCEGINFIRPLEEQCGSELLPCIYYDCNQFSLRGKHIIDGFKAGEGIK